MGSDDSATGLPPERQRPAPTIDLKASEVSSRTIGGEESNAAEPKAAETAKPSDSDPAPAGTTETSAAPRGLSGKATLWAATGCAAIALFGLGVWLGMLWTNRDEQLAQLSARLVRVEAGLGNLPAAETATKMASDHFVSLNKRLDDLASNVRDARSRAENAAAAAEAAQKAAGNAPEQGRGDTEALSSRIAALEQSTRANDRDLAADDKVSRRAVVASALRDAVERGNPFTAELAAAKTFATDSAALTPLEGFASTGVPSTVSLARELSALVQPMTKLIGEPARSGGVMEKIQASAERLVRIRPVGDAPGDDPSAVVARLEAKAARNDISGALTDLGKLPAPVRAPAEPWIKRAAARDAALAASRQFAQDALGALGKPSL